MNEHLEGEHYDPFLKCVVPSREQRIMADGYHARISPDKKSYQRKEMNQIQEYSMEDRKPLPYTYCSLCRKRFDNGDAHKKEEHFLSYCTSTK